MYLYKTSILTLKSTKDPKIDIVHYNDNIPIWLPTKERDSHWSVRQKLDLDDGPIADQFSGSVEPAQPSTPKNKRQRTTRSPQQTLIVISDDEPAS
jgi:hypothetical protein